MCSMSDTPSLKLDSCKQMQIVVWCKSAHTFKISDGNECRLNVHKQVKSA